ncbi:MAG: tetratricopeptide repeat protein [Candidatus Brocadiae bacterium]|nr:tetratricopeptide repeat protein [Candidatus Brocadiia bacterium]
MTVHSAQAIRSSEALRMGRRSATKGLYAEAISFYEKGLAQNPDDVALLNNLADACLKGGRIDRAASYANRAVEAAPDDAFPDVTLGQVLQGQGKHKEAVARVLQAQQKLERLVPEFEGITFDSIERLVKRLSTRAKFELAGKEWIRIIYVVKSLVETCKVELGYVRKGVSWHFLHEIRQGALQDVAANYRRFKQKVGIHGDGPSAIARTVGAVAAVTGAQQVTLGEQTADRCTIQVLACWRHSVIRSMGLDDSPGWIPCSVSCAEHMDCAARAINPAIGFSFSATVPDGAPCCRGVFAKDMGRQ